MKRTNEQIAQSDKKQGHSDYSAVASMDIWYDIVCDETELSLPDQSAGVIDISFVQELFFGENNNGLSGWTDTSLYFPGDRREFLAGLLSKHCAVEIGCGPIDCADYE